MQPRLLYLDLETSPVCGFAWGQYEVNLVGIYRDWSILSFCAKWDDGPAEVFTIDPPKSLRHFLENKESDKRLVKDLWRFLDQADIVVMQNGDRFDVKKSNARFLYYNLPPPSPYKTVDTLKAVKKVSANTSNKLDDLGHLYNLGRKVEHQGFSLWVSCMSGDKSAWKTMREYNEGDVLLLEKLYKRLLPWISNHPNLDNYSPITCCPKCQSTNLIRKGYQYNKTTKYARILCKDCGGWSRSPVNIAEKRPIVSI